MSCPANPPAPPGYRVWRGPVPTELTQWAMQLRDNIAPWPYGQTWSMQYADPTSGQTETVVARKDHHSWTYRGGQLVTGLCIPGITLYSPLPAGTTSASAAVGGDPLAGTPDGTEAVYGADTVPSPPASTNWGLVLLDAAILAAVAAGFWYGIKGAARA